MKNIFLFFGILTVFSVTAQAQEIIPDSTQTETLKTVLLSAIRAKPKTPIAFSNISKAELESKNLGQDLPILLDQLPSVVTTSDAGAGVGYTGIRVRGSDATRVNVTINGIPYNDAESQSTYWVNMPDFVSSVEDIQLQRGVGTSTNGSGAFGASLNLKTIDPSATGYAILTNTIGSYGTRKHSISLGSGLINKFYATGRLSKILSDGYIDRATSNLSSYYVEGGFVSSNFIIKGIVFGGQEKTYQSWYGTPQAVVENDRQGILDFIARNYVDEINAQNLLNSGRKYNYYTYDNEIDHYEQTHHQLHISHQLNPYWSTNLSGNYTKGKGYFEQFKTKEKVDEYFPSHASPKATGDVVRRRWLDNDFYVLVGALNYKKQGLSTNLGMGYNRYIGNHFGELIWNSFPVDIPIRTHYYDSKGEKEDFNTYFKTEYNFNNHWLGYIDLQYRTVGYKALGLSSDLEPINVQKNYHFFNPKAGLTYSINNYNSAYFSVAVANREPNRDDLTKNPELPKPEHLIDFELGYKLKYENYYATANIYAMHYKNQLVLTGDLDASGDPIRENVNKSYRNGIELQSGYKFSKKIRLDANATFSKNIIKAYNDVVFDTQYDPNTYDTVSYLPITTPYRNSHISFSPGIIAGGTLSYTLIDNFTMALISKYVGEQFLDNTSSKSKRISAYWVNNFNASYSIKPSWVKEIQCNLLVNNIFNTKYVSNGYTYSYYYRPEGSNDSPITENFYYPQATLNFLLGLTLKI